MKKARLGAVPSAVLCSGLFAIASHSEEVLIIGGAEYLGSVQPNLKGAVEFVGATERSWIQNRGFCWRRERLA